MIAHIRSTEDADILPCGKGLTFLGEDTQPSATTIATSCQKNHYSIPLRNKILENKEQLKSMSSEVHCSLDKGIKIMPNHPAEPYSPERKEEEKR